MTRLTINQLGDNQATPRSLLIKQTLEISQFKQLIQSEVSNAMNNIGNDEPDTPANNLLEGQSSSYQTIADPADQMKNCLVQHGVDLNLANISSDSQKRLQNKEENVVQNMQQNQELPLESFERENTAHAALQQFPQNNQAVLGDRDGELPVPALSLGQPSGDSEQFQTATGMENQGVYVDQKTLHTSNSNNVATLQAILSTAEAGQKKGAGVESNPKDELAGPLTTAAQPDAQMVEERSSADNPTSSKFDLEKNEKSVRESFIQSDSEYKKEKILEVHHELASEVIQSLQIEKRTEKSQESSHENVNEAQPSGRTQRQCVKNTPNYSHTHKGITSSSANKNVTPFETESKENKLDGKDMNDLADKPHQSAAEVAKVNQADNKNKLAGRRTYEEICRSYESMFAFDWELRDINNLRHPPDREVTPIVVWFYINILYFPYNAQDLAKVPFEQFVKPIFESLERVADLSGEISYLQQKTKQLQAKAGSSQDKSAQASQSGGSELLMEDDHPQEMPAMSQMVPHVRGAEDFVQPQYLPLNHEDPSQPELIQKLQIEDHFFEFRDMFRSEMRIIKDTMAGQDSDDEDQSMSDLDNEDQLDRLLPSNKDERDEALIEMLLAQLDENLDKLRAHNKEELFKQYSKFTQAYKIAEKKANLIIAGHKDEEPRLQFPYNPTKLHEYGLDFLSYVDPYFLADVKENKEWYMQNQNEVLLNVSYPSKQEKEFLRHIEQWQQEKNDLNYKRILQQLEEGADDPNSNGPNGLNIQRYNQMSAHKRGLIVQEDAQCAICNNGDYEDEDLIVFCGACNIPVHQRCYGIDKIPEEDWLCNNCDAFYMRRGIMVKCILCPKRGGAMKPTSIFRTYEHFMRYHTAAQKKKGLQHQNYFASLLSNRNSQDTSNNAQEELQASQDQLQSSKESQMQALALQVSKQSSSGRSHRFQFFEREDKNHALSQILSREKNFQDSLEKITYRDKETFPQSKVELHFLESESITEIPEDYTFFLQRNEQRLECPETVPTETLYEWVHLSCAMWIPGPSVTPKTPVRMSKIDVKRFDLQCIICGKRNSGACIQCQHSRCMISFHIECARRANYFLEVERVDRERNYRVFCEKHRPLKIVREMEEKDKQTLEEVQKFSKVIDRCLDIYARVDVRQTRQKRLQPFSKPPLPEPPSKREIMAEKKKERLTQQRQKQQQRQNEIQAKKDAVKLKRDQEREERETQKKIKKDIAHQQALKRAQTLQAKQEQQQQVKQATVVQSKPEPAPTPVKWKDKDKKILFERVRDRYLQLFKLRVNVLRVDPMVKIKKKQTMLEKKNQKEMRKIEKIRREKQSKKIVIAAVNQLYKLGQQQNQRVGLRSRSSLIAIDGQNGIAGELEHSAAINQADMSSMANQPFNGGENMSEDNNDMSEDQDQMSSVRNKSNKIGDDEFFHGKQAGGEDAADSDSVRRPKIGELMAEEVDPYFKFASPSYIQELDWAITFSKYDFPWYEIRFGKFSARECYKKYTGTVRDAMTFYKKILGGKDKYKKYIAGQLDEAQRSFFGSMPEDSIVNRLPQQAAQTEPAEQANELGNESDIELFCKCRGEFQSQTGYFVMCENEEKCMNGGWLHPECTRDLFHLTQDQIMNLDKWYCEDCIDARNPPAKKFTSESKSKSKSNQASAKKQQQQLQQHKNSASPEPKQAKQASTTIVKAASNDAIVSNSQNAMASQKSKDKVEQISQAVQHQKKLPNFAIDLESLNQKQLPPLVTPNTRNLITSRPMNPEQQVPVVGAGAAQPIPTASSMVVVVPTFTPPSLLQVAIQQSQAKQATANNVLQQQSVPQQQLPSQYHQMPQSQSQPATRSAFIPSHLFSHQKEQSQSSQQLQHQPSLQAQRVVPPLVQQNQSAIATTGLEQRNSQQFIGQLRPGLSAVLNTLAPTAQLTLNQQLAKFAVQQQQLRLEEQQLQYQQEQGHVQQQQNVSNGTGNLNSNGTHQLPPLLRRPSQNLDISGTLAVSQLVPSTSTIRQPQNLSPSQHQPAISQPQATQAILTQPIAILAHAQVLSEPSSTNLPQQPSQLMTELQQSANQSSSKVTLNLVKFSSLANFSSNQTPSNGSNVLLQASGYYQQNQDISFIGW